MLMSMPKRKKNKQFQSTPLLIDLVNSRSAKEKREAKLSDFIFLTIMRVTEEYLRNKRRETSSDHFSF
jgi:hypothetical protein